MPTTATAGAVSTTASTGTAETTSTLMSMMLMPLNSIISTLNTLPKSMYDTSLDATRSIASKLHDYADSMSGKSASKDTDTRGLMIEKSHRAYLDDLRHRDMTAYRALLTFADTLVEQPRDVQATMLKARFENKAAVSKVPI